MYPGACWFAGDRHISYLPLAHIYERNTLTTAIRAGVAVGFYRGNVLELLDDVAELKPTVFTSVPRLYNRIYDKARDVRAANSDVVTSVAGCPVQHGFLPSHPCGCAEGRATL